MIKFIKSILTLPIRAAKQTAGLFANERSEKNAVINIAPLPRMEKRDVERLFARVFLSEDGQKVLSYLQATTFQRALPTDASDAQLRQMEGQRALLSTIQRLAQGEAMQRIVRK